MIYWSIIFIWAFLELFHHNHPGSNIILPFGNTPFPKYGFVFAWLDTNSNGQPNALVFLIPTALIVFYPVGFFWIRREGKA
jgi:hypothetical protein